MERNRLLLALAASGAGSVWLQSTLVRELFVCFSGSELSFGLALAVWLAGVACGAAAGRGAGRLRGPASAYSGVMVALALVGAAAFVGLRLSRNLLGAAPGVMLGPGPLAGAAVLAMGPPGLLEGLSFPLACESLDRAGLSTRAVAATYVADGLGSFAGGLGFTFLVAGMLPQAGAAAGAGVLLCLGALAARPGLAAGAAACLFAGALAVSGPCDAALARLRWRSLGAGELLASVDTRYQNISLARSGRQVDVHANGVYLFSYPDEPDADIEAAAIAAQRPGAGSALVVGASPEVASALALHIPEVTFVELDPVLPALLRRYAPEALSPRLRLVEGWDGRRWLREHADERFDLIVSMPGDPATAAANRYFTEDFFRLAASRLSEGGVFVTGVSSGASYLAGEVGDYVSVVLGAMRRVFPATLATGGERSLLFGSVAEGVLERDPAVLERRIEEGRWAVPGAALRLVFDEERMTSLAQAVASRPPVENTDARPVAYLYNLIVLLREGGVTVPWLSRAVTAPDERSLLVLPAIALLLAGTAAVSRGRCRAVPTVALGFTGFCAMGLWLLVLYAIQTALGSAYSSIGAATGTLMAGLSAGGLLGGTLGARPTGRALLLVDAGIAALFLLLAAVLGRAVPAAAYYLALFLGAVLTGAEFPLAAQAAGGGEPTGRPGRQARSGGLAVLVDNLGGCVGAVAIGLLLVPVLGLPAAALSLAAAKALTAAALAVAPRPPRAAGPPA